jgi:hypothetical protein
MEKKIIRAQDVLANSLDLLGITANAYAQLLSKDRSLVSRYLSGEYSVPDAVLDQTMVLLINSDISPLQALRIPDEKDFYYHSSPMELEGAIDVNRNRGVRNDFGFGFYLGESLLQSASYSKDPSKPLHIYRYRKRDFSSLRILDFQSKSTLDWFIFIGLNREKIERSKYADLLVRIQSEAAVYDAVKGKIADSFTYQIIEGLFNDVYDVDQAEACSVVLALGDQLCLKNSVFAASLQPEDLFVFDPSVTRYFFTYGNEKRQRQNKATEALLKRPPEKERLFSYILEKRYGKK